MVPTNLLVPKISIGTSTANHIPMETRIPKPSKVLNCPQPRRYIGPVFLAPALRLSSLPMAKLRLITTTNPPGESTAELEWQELRNRVLQDWIPPPAAPGFEGPGITQVAKIGQEAISRENTRKRVVSSTYVTPSPCPEPPTVSNSLSRKTKSCVCSAISKLDSGIRAINKFYGPSLKKWDDEYRISSVDGKMSEAEVGWKEIDAAGPGTDEKEQNVADESTGQTQPPQTQSQKMPCALKRWRWKSSTKRKANPQPKPHAQIHPSPLTSSTSSAPPVPKPQPQEQAQTASLSQTAKTTTSTPPETDYFSPWAPHARPAQGHRRRRHRHHHPLARLAMPQKERGNADRHAEALARRLGHLEGALGGRGSVEISGAVGEDASSAEEEEQVQEQEEEEECEHLGTPWSGLETVFEELDEDGDGNGRGGGDREGDCRGGVECCTGELCLRHRVCVREAMACMAP